MIGWDWNPSHQNGGLTWGWCVYVIGWSQLEFEIQAVVKSPSDWDSAIFSRRDHVFSEKITSIDLPNSSNLSKDTVDCRRHSRIWIMSTIQLCKHIHIYCIHIHTVNGKKPAWSVFYSMIRVSPMPSGAGFRNHPQDGIFTLHLHVSRWLMISWGIILPYIYIYIWGFFHSPIEESLWTDQDK